MTKIAKLYIPLLKEIKVTSVSQFMDICYRRMSQERFEDLLRSYLIVPEQHRLKFVREALQCKESHSDNETQEDRPSNSCQSSVTITELPTIPFAKERIQSLGFLYHDVEQKLSDSMPLEKRKRLALRLTGIQEEITLLTEIVQDADSKER